MATKREEILARLVEASEASRMLQELAAILAEHHAWLSALDPVGPLAMDRYDKPSHLEPAQPTGGEETLVMWLAERCGTSIFGIPTPAQVAEEGDLRIAALKAELDATKARVAAEGDRRIAALRAKLAEAGAIYRTGGGANTETILAYLRDHTARENADGKEPIFGLTPFEAAEMVSYVAALRASLAQAEERLAEAWEAGYRARQDEAGIPNPYRNAAPGSSPTCGLCGGCGEVSDMGSTGGARCPRCKGSGEARMPGKG